MAQSSIRPVPDRIAVVLTQVNIRRFVPGFVRYNRPNTTFWQLNSHQSVDETVSLIRQWKPLGLIAECIPGISDPLFELGLPTVAVQYNLPPGSPHSCCDVDDEAVGETAAKFFLGKRLRSFAFYGKNIQYSEQRLRGFLRGLAAENQKPEVLVEPFEGPERYSEYWPAPGKPLLNWLRGLPKPVGILAAHDPMGRALIEAARHAELDVPSEVAVLGVNDDPLVCPLSQPALSSVRVPWTRLGSELMGLLERRIAGEPPQSLLIEPGAVSERLSTDILAVDDPLLRRALEAMRVGGAESLNIHELSKQIGCSRRHLERMFREHLGRSPKEELTRRRLSIARDLLLNSNEKIAAISQICGWSNPQPFHVAFVAAEGVSPGVFRKQGGRLLRE